MFTTLKVRYIHGYGSLQGTELAHLGACGDLREKKPNSSGRPLVEKRQMCKFHIIILAYVSTKVCKIYKNY